MKKVHILCLTLLATSAFADAYRHTDESGNVIFSDRPSEDAEKIELKEIQTVKPIAAPKAPGNSSAPEEDKETAPGSYTSLSITAPEDNQAFAAGDANNITVSVEAQPALNAEHRLKLYLDGKQDDESSSTSFTLTGLARGAHSVKVEIVDEEGAVMKSSNEVKFTVYRPTVNAPVRSGN